MKQGFQMLETLEYAFLRGQYNCKATRELGSQYVDQETL